ncbi:MAG: DegV family protein [bacterium]
MSESKKPISIVVDEAADLPKEIIGKYNITVVPLNVFWPEIENVPGDNFFQRIRELEKRGDKSFAKTSQPAPQKFIEAFSKQLESFEKVICLTITSKHSGTFNSACQAKRFMGEKANNIYVIDSLNGSSGLSLIALKAAAFVKKGLSIEEILNKIQKAISETKLYVILDSPKRLEASGRISPTVTSWLVKMQNIGIRPIIGLKDGKISPIGIKTGAKDVPTAMFKELESKTKFLRNKGKEIDIVITHCDNLERAEKVRDLIKSNLKNANVVFINITDNILGAVLGPDSLILGWTPKE